MEGCEYDLDTISNNVGAFVIQPSTSLLEYEIDPAELGLEKARPVGKVRTTANI